MSRTAVSRELGVNRRTPARRVVSGALMAEGALAAEVQREPGRGRAAGRERNPAR